MAHPNKEKLKRYPTCTFLLWEYCIHYLSPSDRKRTQPGCIQVPWPTRTRNAKTRRHHPSSPTPIFVQALKAVLWIHKYFFWIRFRGYSWNTYPDPEGQWKNNDRPDPDPSWTKSNRAIIYASTILCKRHVNLKPAWQDRAWLS